MGTHTNGSKRSHERKALGSTNDVDEFGGWKFEDTTHNTWDDAGRWSQRKQGKRGRNIWREVKLSLLLQTDDEEDQEDTVSC